MSSGRHGMLASAIFTGVVKATESFSRKSSEDPDIEVQSAACLSLFYKIIPAWHFGHCRLINTNVPLLDHLLPRILDQLSFHGMKSWAEAGRTCLRCSKFIRHSNWNISAVPFVELSAATSCLSLYSRPNTCPCYANTKDNDVGWAFA
jgi:hypothetical protein